jgi:hypothetical protein
MFGRRFNRLQRQVGGRPNFFAAMPNPLFVYDSHLDTKEVVVIIQGVPIIFGQTSSVSFHTKTKKNVHINIVRI